MSARERSWWGWGYEDRQIDPGPLAAGVVAAARLRARRAGGPGRAGRRRRARRRASTRRGRPPRATACATRTAAPTSTRSAPSAGEVARSSTRVARPRDETEVEEVLAWARDANAAVIPYGGGTSVVGGVAPRVPARFDGVSRST